jgi:hypothetical protein
VRQTKIITPLNEQPIQLKYRKHYAAQLVCLGWIHKTSFKLTTSLQYGKLVVNNGLAMIFDYQHLR